MLALANRHGELSVIYYTNPAQKNVCSAVSVSIKIKRNTHKLIVTLGASSGKHQAEQPSPDDRGADVGRVIIPTVRSRTPCKPTGRLAVRVELSLRSNNVSLAKITANTTHIRS